MGYTRLAYLKSTGTQYIDTGFTPNQDTRVVMDAQATALSANGTCWFGSRTGGRSNSYNAYVIAEGYWWGYGNTYSQIASTDIYGRLTFDANKSTLTVTDSSGSEHVISHDYTTFTCPHSLTLLALWSSESSGIYDRTQMAGKLYSCQIYDNDVLVRDFVPMVNEVGVCGLYDNVEGKFYTSPNGELFEGVREDNGLPFGYMPCEYIQSFGEEYIDTGFTPNQDTRVVMDADIGNTWSDFPCLFGVGTTSGSGSSDKFMLFVYGSIQGFHDHYGRQTINPPVSNGLGRHVFDKNKNITNIDSVAISTFDSSVFQNVSNLHLFAALDGGIVGYYCSMKVYSCQIYDNGTLVRDYIPCQSPTRVYGLFDKVNGVFYTTPTGAFTGKWAGKYFLKVPLYELRRRTLKQVAKRDLPNGYTSLSYLVLDGSALIDTNYKPNQNTKIVADLNIEAYADQSALFGVRESGKNLSVFTGDANSGYQFDYASTQGSTYGTLASSGRHTLAVDCGVFSVDGTSVKTLSGTFQSTQNMYIGTINNSGTPMFDYPFRGDVYSFQIYESDVLVCDFVPAIDPMGESGLYDKVNGTFHKANMVGLPEGYAYVDGVYSNGKAYINTGVNPTSNTRAVIDVNIEESTSQQAVFGSRTGIKGFDFLIFTAASNGWQFDYGNQTVNGTTGTHDGRVLIDINKNVLYINGVVNYTLAERTFTSNYPMFLGSIGFEGSPMTSYPLVGKIYSCKIYDGDTLLRDYISCKNLSTGVQGLYDKVNDVFYTSSGSSPFGDKSLYTADFDYTGGVQSVTLSAGTYKLQVWGAEGGAYDGYGGQGGYSEGILTLSKATTLYVVVGGSPSDVTSGSAGTTVAGGYNGGGDATIVSFNYITTFTQGGGGGTDIRIGANSLYARVIVAGGGAGVSNNAPSANYAGGGIYGGGGYRNVEDGIQTPNTDTEGTAGSFGKGASATTKIYNWKYAPSGAGGGWYGGAVNYKNSDSDKNVCGYCGGGSGYIYCAVTAGSYPSGCLLNSSYYLSSAKSVRIKDNTGYTSTNAGFQSGLTYEYNPREGRNNYWGNGYARITQIS